LIFKDRLKNLRAEQNVSVAQLAERLGKGESAIRMWEIGRSYPDLDILYKLADIFDCSADYLIGRSDIKNTIHAKQVDLANSILSNVLGDYQHQYVPSGILATELLSDLLRFKKSFLPLLNYLDFYTTPQNTRQIDEGDIQTQLLIKIAGYSEVRIDMQSTDSLSLIRFVMQKEFQEACDLVRLKRLRDEED
jgi:transcriptional regulator with XRE-family HTH domain